MDREVLKRLLRGAIFVALVLAVVCLLLLIVSAMMRSPQHVLRFWAGGIGVGLVSAAILGAWRVLLSANETFEIANAATGSIMKARALWAGQVVAIGLLLANFIGLIRLPTDVYYGTIVVLIGLGVWARLLGESALRGNDRGSPIGTAGVRDGDDMAVPGGVHRSGGSGRGNQGGPATMSVARSATPSRAARSIAAGTGRPSFGKRA